MIGERISHYRIESKLGAGGMGEVFLAQDTSLSRRVALKFLPESLCGIDEARKRFLREAQAAAALNHPNIVTIHEVAEHEGRPFFAMEYVDGKSLRDYCAVGERTLDELLQLAGQIADGLERAHRAGIIHRDLKPGNILVNADGNVKIVDFGLAQVRGAARLTQTGSTLGTASYMSPEQAQGLTVDHRSDLFSFGAVAYEMLAGQAAFAGEHDAAIVYAIVHEEPAPLARYRRDVPDEISKLVTRCMAKKPDERYQSAADLAADVRRLRRISDSAPAIKAAPKRKMLAILPFENLGAAEDEYFADGITEEIISRLAAVKDLGVISRTSVMQYKGTRKPMREIGAELGADHILEGTVRWGKGKGGTSRVRITPQLIKVADDTHLWSDRYDRVLEDIFEVQSEIAEQVTGQLNVALLAPERAAMNARPTDNLDAYNAYLRGKEYGNRPTYGRRDFTLSAEMFHRAVELDPQFAQAWAGLGLAHSNLYHHGHDRSDECKEHAQTAITRALALAPESAEVRLANGLFVYRCYKDYDTALSEFEWASAILPNSSELWLYKGAIQRRRGDFEDAVKSFTRAFELDPRNSILPSELGSTLTMLRRYEEADRLLERSIAMDPGQMLAYNFRCGNFIAWRGDLPAARAMLEHVIASDVNDSHTILFEFRQLMFERRYDDALACLEPIGDEIHNTQMGNFTKSSLLGYVYAARGETDHSHRACETALRAFTQYVKDNPGEFRGHMALGEVYAGLGQKDRAVASGLEAVASMPLSKDYIEGSFALYHLAIIYATVGESELACETIEKLLSIPSWFSRQHARLEPAFDRLHGYPRYEELIARQDRVF